MAQLSVVLDFGRLPEEEAVPAAYTLADIEQMIVDEPPSAQVVLRANCPKRRQPEDRHWRDLGRPVHHYSRDG